jgi:hypothetical protein
MKRKALALTLILAIIVSTIMGAEIVNWATANPYPYTNCSSSFVTVSVLSPENKSYDTNSILIAIFAGAYPGVWGVTYSLDGGPSIEIAPEKWNGHTFNESVWLNRLSEGSHNIVAEGLLHYNQRNRASRCNCTRSNNILTSKQNILRNPNSIRLLSE